MTVPIDAPEPQAAPSDPVGLTVSRNEKGVSQGRLVFRRFLSHKPAVVSMILLFSIIVFALSAVGYGPIPGWWQFNHEQLLSLAGGGRPTLSVIPEWLGGAGIAWGDHPFGQNTPGKDYFALTMRGLLISTVVMFVLGLFASFLGVVVGAVAGYYRGWIDAVLMRLTDVVIVIPIIVIGAIVGAAAGSAGPPLFAITIAFFAWTGVARLVRGEFLSLREREFVEAARLAGASDVRIIFKHILPNAIGVVIVASTLLIASAIILESSLSYLGYGIRAPEVSLGLLIAQNESAFQTRPWLFWWPAAFIVGLSLLVNFIGDGLRDAFDPRQKRVRLKRVRELPADAVVSDKLTVDVPTIDLGGSLGEDRTTR